MKTKCVTVLILTVALLVGGFGGRRLALTVRDVPLRKSFSAVATKAREVPISFGLSRFFRDVRDASTPRVDVWSYMPRRVSAHASSPSFCLHLLRANGKTATCELEPDGRTISALEILTHQESSRAVLGEATFVVTDYGVCFPTRTSVAAVSADEDHRDQCLGTLAELGMALCLPLYTASQTFTLRDVLSDSLANFSLQQNEIEWTALAYSLYLPPVREWANRFGDEFSFDDLAQEMLERTHRLHRFSCCGTHLLSAISALIAADRECRILSEDVLAGTRASLVRLIEDVQRAQLLDGSWAVDWYMERGRRGKEDSVERWSESARLIATGHLAEWLMYLPDGFVADEVVLTRAARWLKATLDNARVNNVTYNICALAHVIAFLRAFEASGRDVNAGGARYEVRKSSIR